MSTRVLRRPTLSGALCIAALCPIVSLAADPPATVRGAKPAAAAPAVVAAPAAAQAAPANPAAAANPAPANGPAPPFSADRFARTLLSDNEDAELRAIEFAHAHYRNEPGIGEAMWRVLKVVRAGKRPITPATLAAIQLFGSLPDEAQFGRQADFLKADEVTVELSAAAGMAERKAPEVLPAMVAIRKRADYPQVYGIRSAALAIVSMYDDPEAVDWLIETISTSDGQLKYETARALGRLTRKNFGGKAKEWREWWAAHRSEYDPSRALRSTPNWAPVDIPWEERVPRLFDVPVYAKRIVFVVDRSGSTRRMSPAGYTGLDLAKAEFKQFLFGMPTTAYFNVIAFDTQMRPWRPEMTQSTVPNANGAIVSMWLVFSGGGTALYDALDAALSHDSNLEMIILVSDGEATRGKLVEPSAILRTITRRNAFHRVTIDTLGMHPIGRAEELMKGLAAQNHGVYRPLW